jgi:DNA helicase-4
MWRSVKLVRNGQTSFVRDESCERGDLRNLRFIMIDEFQDFSQMFFELVRAIRLVNPDVRIFCVGDDWQAINAFAGSDLEYFNNFKQYFHNTSQYNICTNYRSPIDIIKVSNCLMNGLGITAQPYTKNRGWVRFCTLDSFKPSAIERDRHNGYEMTPALLRVIRNFLDRGLDVVMLSRMNATPWYISYNDIELQESKALSRFLEHVRFCLPEEDRVRVTVSTVHKYKGLESDAVIVLDAIANRYPLIHPHWFFLRVFDNSIEKIEQEERRLFYVAMTRAQNSLALFTETSAKSPYLNDIQKHMNIKLLTWDELPPVPSLESPRLEIRVFNVYDVRDKLKNLKYQWNNEKKYWCRAVMAEGFSFDVLLEQPRVSSKVSIEVYSEKLELLYQQ